MSASCKTKTTECCKTYFAKWKKRTALQRRWWQAVQRRLFVQLCVQALRVIEFFLYWDFCLFVCSRVGLLLCLKIESVFAVFPSVLNETRVHWMVVTTSAEETVCAVMCSGPKGHKVFYTRIFDNSQDIFIANGLQP